MHDVGPDRLPQGTGQVRCEFREEAIPRLFKPGEATYQNLGLAMGVLGVSMLFAAAPLSVHVDPAEPGNEEASEE